MSSPRLIDSKTKTFLYLFLISIGFPLLGVIAPFSLAIITYFVALKYLGNMLKERIIYMNKFHEYEESDFVLIKMFKKIQVKWKILFELHSEVFAIAVTSLFLVCPFKYHPIALIIVFFMFWSLYFYINRIFKIKKAQGANLENFIKKYYFQFSLIVGVIYSVIVNSFDNIHQYKKMAIDIVHLKPCAFITFIDDGMNALLNPLGIIGKIIGLFLNIEVVSGFVFTLFILILFIPEDQTISLFKKKVPKTNEEPSTDSSINLDEKEIIIDTQSISTSTTNENISKVENNH